MLRYLLQKLYMFLNVLIYELFRKYRNRKNGRIILIIIFFNSKPRKEKILKSI